MARLDPVLASRGLGVESALSALPGVVVVAFALVTQLGDVWFLSTLVVSSYWLGSHTPRLGAAVDRDRMGRVVGILLVSFTVVAVIKPLLSFPRPAGAAVAPHADLVPGVLTGVYEWAATGDGYGFPSGHALGSTLVYGGFAWAIRVGSRRQRVAFVAGMVGLLSLSRLVLGLHFLVDVLVGAALGIFVLAVALRLASPRAVCGFAALVGIVGLPVVGATPTVVAATGAAVGATLAWHAVGESIPSAPTAAGARATIGLGLLTVVVLGVAAVLFQQIVPVTGLVALLGGGLVVAMPLLGERVAKKRLVED